MPRHFSAYLSAVLALGIVRATPDSGSCDGIPWAQSDGSVDCQDYDGAYAESLAFITASMPPWDQMNSETLLEGGVVGVSLNLSLDAYKTYRWAATVSKEMFMNDVVPYG